MYSTKPIIGVISLLVLSGCGEIVTGADISKFQNLCKPHGGIDFVRVYKDTEDVAHCVAGRVLIRGDD